MRKKVKVVPEVKFDPVAWSGNVEMRSMAHEAYTHICNIRRCWIRGHISDMIWNLEMAEIKLSMLREMFEKEK